MHVALINHLLAGGTLNIVGPSGWGRLDLARILMKKAGIKYRVITPLSDERKLRTSRKFIFLSAEHVPKRFRDKARGACILISERKIGKKTIKMPRPASIGRDTNIPNHRIAKRFGKERAWQEKGKEPAVQSLLGGKKVTVSKWAISEALAANVVMDRGGELLDRSIEILAAADKAASPGVFGACFSGFPAGDDGFLPEWTKRFKR